MSNYSASNVIQFCPTPLNSAQSQFHVTPSFLHKVMVPMTLGISTYQWLLQLLSHPHWWGPLMTHPISFPFFLSYLHLDPPNLLSELTHVLHFYGILSGRKLDKAQGEDDLFGSIWIGSVRHVCSSFSSKSFHVFPSNRLMWNGVFDFRQC